MSNKISSIIQTKKIGSPTKKAILLYMADKASDDGSGIWTSKKNMANDLELTDRAVRQHIKEMVVIGLLIEAGHKKCSSGYTVDYSISMPHIMALESTRSTPEHVSPLNDVHPMPCTTFTPTPEPRSYKPSIEPSIEPNIYIAKFDEFYAAYPRKRGKGAARTAWLKACKKEDADYIIASATLYKNSLTEKDLQFVPYPATWLNQERWSDEIDQKPQNNNVQLQVLKSIGLKYDA